MADINLQYLDQPLNDMSVGYTNDDYYAQKLFPVVPVNKQSGRYWVFYKEKFRQYETIRRAGAAARQIGKWTLSNNPYFCDDHSLKDLIPDEQLKNSDGTDVERNTVDNLNEAIFLDYELRTQKLLLSIANAGAMSFNITLSGTAQWSDYNNSNPIAAVFTQKSVIKRNIVKEPNTLAVTYPLHNVLAQHPLIIDRYKHVDTGILTPEHLKKAFQVDNYWIMGAEYDSANEGQPASLGYVWGDVSGSGNPNGCMALLAYVPDSPQKLDPALGYTFRWLFGEPDLEGVLTKRYRSEPEMSDVVEVHRYDDVEVVAPLAGGLWQNAA